MIRLIFIWVGIVATLTGMSAQTAIEPNSRTWHTYERLAILYGGEYGQHLSIRNARRDYLYDAAYTQITNNPLLIKEWTPLLLEQDDFRGLEDSVSRRLDLLIPEMDTATLWNTFYTNPHYLYSLNTPNFYLRFDPILHLGAGRETDRTLFSNQRGAYVRGGIDQKVFFEAQVLESQQLLPSYVHQFINRFGAIPGNGFFKGYNSDLLGIKGGVDYNNSNGRVAWKFTDNISATLAYDKNFIGDGYRSLILSDFSNNYFFGRIDTRIWKLHYTNIWGNLATASHRDIRGDELIPTKWFAHHYLSFNISPTFRMGVFETVVFGRENGSFDINYLIPVIFYRSVEGSLGSPDNVLLGADLRWDLGRRFSLYGQLILDEFRISELLIERRGWWANKYGLQMGGKYFDAFGMRHLTGQAEVNLVRPFTYTHKDSLRNYVHYNMPMAHPLGANFIEFLTRWQYNSPGRWNAELAGFWIVQGRSEEENVGWNIVNSYSFNRQRDFGFSLPEGERNRILLLRAQVNYEIYPDLEVYVRSILRNHKQGDAISISDFIGSLGITYNFQLPEHDF